MADMMDTDADINVTPELSPEQHQLLVEGDEPTTQTDVALKPEQVDDLSPIKNTYAVQAVDDAATNVVDGPIEDSREECDPATIGTDEARGIRTSEDKHADSTTRHIEDTNDESVIADQDAGNWEKTVPQPVKTEPAEEKPVEQKPHVCESSDEVANTSSDETGANKAVESSNAVNVPSRCRPGWPAQTPRPSGVQESKHSQSAPNEPRQHHDVPRYNRPSQPHRPDDRQEIARLNARLMKLRDELDAERHKNFNLHKDITAKKQEEMEAALSSMTNELLRKQSTTLSQQAKVESKERELGFREKNIEQLEIYLTEGQKQLHHKYENQEGGRTIADVNSEFERCKGGMEARKGLADLEGKLNIREQDFQLREAAQQMREQQYKALMQCKWEDEVQEKGVSQDKLDEIADLEYNRGFGHGRDTGLREAEEEVRQKSFLEGYAACQRAHITVGKFRQGLISHDSIELDFLLNAAHPNNPFSVGARVGAQETQSKASLLEKQTKVDIAEKRTEKIVTRDVVVQNDHGAQIKVVDSAVVVQKAVEKSVDKPIRKFPIRPTFASQFGKARPFGVDHAILTNVVKGSSGSDVEHSAQTGVANGGPVQQHGKTGPQDLIDLQ